MSVQDIHKIFKIVCQAKCAKGFSGDFCSNVIFDESTGNDLWALESMGDGIYCFRNAMTGFWASAFEDRIFACPSSEDGSIFQLVPAQSPGGFIINLLGTRMVWVVKPFTGSTKLLRLCPALESEDTVFYFQTVLG